MTKQSFRTVPPEQATDPAIQRASNAGNVPADTPDEPTLRGEIANAVEMLAKAGAALTTVYGGRGNYWNWQELRTQHDALHEQLQFLSQLAENLEVRIAREADEKQARVAAEDAARKRAEAMRPDRVRLLAVADAVEAIAVPAVRLTVQAYADRIRQKLDHAAIEIRAIIEEMRGGQ